MALLVTIDMRWIDRQYEGIIMLTAQGLSCLMMSDTNAGFYAAHNVHKKEEDFFFDKTARTERKKIYKIV